MVVEWIDCCRSQIFTVSLGINFYTLIIFICSEMAVSRGNKRFLASPETEKPVSAYTFSIYRIET